jgi:hypothetical protein
MTYDALCREAVKGKSLGPRTACPACGVSGRLTLTSSWVERTSRWVGTKCVEDRSTPVPLCRCGACKRRIRVLPIEIVPGKHCTWKVIETCCSAYSDADMPQITLRRSVARMGRGHPHASALHGWLGALGERALGRLDRTAGYVPVCALIAQTARQHEGDLFELWAQPCAVAEGKYRSPKRAEQLAGCARLFATASALFPQCAHPFFEWEQHLQAHFHVTAWSFPARFVCTSFQQHLCCRAGVQYAPKPRNSKGRERNENHGARSPP